MSISDCQVLRRHCFSKLITFTPKCRVTSVPNLNLGQHQNYEYNLKTSIIMRDGNANQGFYYFQIHVLNTYSSSNLVTRWCANNSTSKLKFQGVEIFRSILLALLIFGDHKSAIELKNYWSDNFILSLMRNKMIRKILSDINSDYFFKRRTYLDLKLRELKGRWRNYQDGVDKS